MVTLVTCISVSLGLAYSTLLVAQDVLLRISPEGPRLPQVTKYRPVYLKPIEAFDKYERPAILQCYMDQAESWQRNRTLTAGIERGVVTADKNRIKTVLTRSLQKKGGYRVVNTVPPDVLVLKPALLNRKVAAPNSNTVEMSMTMITSADQSILYLALWDSVSNTLLTRVIDMDTDQDSDCQVDDSAPNIAASDNSVESGSGRLQQYLSAVRGKPASH